MKLVINSELKRFSGYRNLKLKKKKHISLYDKIVLPCYCCAPLVIIFHHTASKLKALKLVPTAPMSDARNK